MATTDTTGSSLTSFRVAMFEELGFSASEALILATANQDVIVGKLSESRLYQIPLCYHRVRKLLAQGCTPDQVLEIFS